MPTRRSGHNDSLVDSRLAWLTGTAFPAAPAGLWISLLSGLPGSDGSSVVEISLRVSVTYGSPTTASGSVGFPHERFIQPTASVSFTIAGTPAPGFHQNGNAWALWSAASGGSPLYVGSYAWSVLVGVATSIPASVFQVFAERV